MAHVRIVMENAGHGEVFVDGVKQKHVLSVEVGKLAAGVINTVKIELLAEKLEVEGEFLIL